MISEETYLSPKNFFSKPETLGNKLVSTPKVVNYKEFTNL